MRQEFVIFKVNKGSLGDNKSITFEEKLKLPALPPSYLEHYEIIDLEYEQKPAFMDCV